MVGGRRCRPPAQFLRKERRPVSRVPALHRCGAPFLMDPYLCRRTSWHETNGRPANPERVPSARHVSVGSGSAAGSASVVSRAGLAGARSMGTVRSGRGGPGGGGGGRSDVEEEPGGGGAERVNTTSRSPRGGVGGLAVITAAKPEGAGGCTAERASTAKSSMVVSASSGAPAGAVGRCARGSGVARGGARSAGSTVRSSRNAARRITAAAAASGSVGGAGWAGVRATTRTSAGRVAARTCPGRRAGRVVVIAPAVGPETRWALPHSRQSPPPSTGTADYIRGLFRASRTGSGQTGQEALFPVRGSRTTPWLRETRSGSSEAR